MRSTHSGKTFPYQPVLCKNLYSLLDCSGLMLFLLFLLLSTIQVTTTRFAWGNHILMLDNQNMMTIIYPLCA